MGATAVLVGEMTSGVRVMTCSCAVGPMKPGGLCEQAGRRALTDEGRTTFAVADGAPTAGALTWTGAHADVDVRAHSLLVGSAASPQLAVL